MEDIMRKIQLLSMRWLLISCLVLTSIFTITQAVEAGTPGNEPEFTISGLVISPAEAKTGQTITINATVKELAKISGIYEGTLRINGVDEETKQLTIGPLGSEQLTFTVSKDTAGTYSVYLDGLSGSFTLTGETTNGSSGSSDSSFPTVAVIVAIIAAIVIIAMVVWLMVAHRRQYQP